MSVCVNVYDLSNEEKNIINSELQIKYFKGNKKQYPKYLYPLIEHLYPLNKHIISIPLHFAISRLNIYPQELSEYPKTNIKFDNSLRPYQEDMHTRVMEEMKSHTIVMSVHVGWGKTIYSLYLASIFNLKTLILVRSSKPLEEQWIESIQKTCPNSKCQLVKTSDELDDECDFYVMNAMLVRKKPFGFFSRIGTLICDEIHLFCSEKASKSMLCVHPYYCIGLSATPFRYDGLDKIIHLHFGEDKFEQKLKRDYVVNVVKTGFDLNYEYGFDGRLDWNSVLVSQVEHKERNKLIGSLVKNNPLLTFLIFCKRIKHCELLEEELNDCNTTIFTGKSADFDKNARVLITTTQKCGPGFDFNKLNALILATDIEAYFIQYLGRVFRSLEVKPVIYDLVDNSPKTLHKHFLSRKKEYTETGAIIKYANTNK